jgi:hypothetical protein
MWTEETELRDIKKLPKVTAGLRTPSSCWARQAGVGGNVQFLVTTRVKFK